MTTAETSRTLALAIGYRPEHVRIDGSDCMVQWRDYAGGAFWCRFDFTEPNVIWPIAERYNAFPLQMGNGNWLAIVGDTGNQPEAVADTAALAVALAVMGYSQKRVKDGQ